MKIHIRTKPIDAVYVYEGHITKDISKNDDEYVEGKYCFEIKSYSNNDEDEIFWLEEPNVEDIDALEDQILEQFYKTV
jgi:hypothetical protein